MWEKYNPNPIQRSVGDCAVRAIAKALNMGWEAAYIALVINGLQMADMPSADSVIGSVLRQYGFRRMNLPDTCPDCYTAKEFCEDNPHGVFVLKLGNSHTATVIDGDLYDSWNSEMETVQYAWYKKGDDK